MLARPAHAPQPQNQPLPLVGRQPALDALLHQWGQATLGLTRVVLVDGEPGIGKSRLLDTLAACVAAPIGPNREHDGAIVLRGGASEAAGMPPYLPFLEALGGHILAADAETLREQAAPFAPVLSTILPEIAVRLGEIPSSYVLPPEQARLRLFEAVDHLLGAITGGTRTGGILAGPRPVLLLFDDLQWADPATLDLLCHIARRHRAGLPLLIVGAYRSGELSLNDSLQRAVAELNRLRVSSTLGLRRLTMQDIAAMASAYLGAPLGPAAVQPLFAHSEGNPFFAEELLLGWLEQGVLVQRTGADGAAIFDLTPSVALPLPPGIVAAVRQRLTHLGRGVADLLQIAAVVGRTFDAETIAAVAGLDADAVDAHLDEATQAQIVRPLGPGAFTFSHDKIRESLYQGLSPSRMRRLHASIGEALEAQAAQAGPSSAPSARHLAELAFHFARAGDAARGASHAISAAEHAIRSYAPAEAAAHLRTALDLLPADDPRRGSLHARLGDALLLTGAEDEAVPAFEAARARFEAAGDSAAAGQAALATGRAWWRQEQIERARIAFEEATALLERAPGPALVAALVDRGSLLASNLHQYEAGIALTRRALALARALQDDRLVIAGTRALGNLLVRGNDLDAGIPLLEEALALATGLGDPFEAAECCAGLATAYLWRGSARLSREITLRRLSFAERCHDLYQLRHVYSWLAFVGALLGERDDVAAHLEQAQAITDDLASPEPQAFLRFVRGVTALSAGAPAQAERHFQDANDLFRAIGPDALLWYLPSIALAQALQGCVEKARAGMAEAEALLARVPGGTMATGDVLAYLVSTDLVLSHLARGDRDRLRQYPARLTPFRGQFHDMLIDRLLGETTLALADYEAARRHLRAAEVTARQEGLTLELARVLAAIASLHQAGAVRAGDRSARELLEECAQLYEQHGNDHESDAIRQQIASLASPTGRPSRPAGLTAREVEVLRLVAAGLSNRQIADNLVISERTVEGHLSSAYGKIGADNRAAATAFVVRHGLA